ncbi:MAG: type I methionyl aminopeptidase [Gammaproteobacteria bacterium]|nr:type I methionyl aminopeptidase [Gammaproteobacteria bacterium]
MNIPLKTPREVEKMRAAGEAAWRVLEMIAPKVHAGVTTGELDDCCHRFITGQLDAVPAPLNYKGFPRSICTSVNHVVCHGIPGQRKLKNGDIVNIDITVIKDDYHGDTSRMFAVGRPPVLAERLMRVSYECMAHGIRAVAPGARLGDIGHRIQSHAERNDFSVVRDYCGHGIGRDFHEDPQVLHYGRPDTGIVLEPGMVFTIEPMINAGRCETRVLPDSWTVVTRDHSLSSQWEHTVLVTENGCEVLTLPPGEAL